MSTSIVPDKQSRVGKKQQIEHMFDDIANRYDFLNRLLSFRVDVQWRKKVIAQLRPFQPQKILDIATGTADLAIALNALNPDSIIGLDLSAQMLAKGQEKINALSLQNKIQLVKGDSEHLIFEDNRFDAITVAFGVRNFENLEKGLQEIHRTLKPQGQFIILEFSKVKHFPIKQFYQLYFRYITPLIGKLFSKNATAYSYLPNSVAVFPEGEQMCVILQNIGFKKVTCKPLSFGIASIYHGEK
ncbi:MAG: bifunctional demethylmenaquinone methyltransferase/2-methoxy-6-polyprenyl-1,4-benzoquinol methylase UbiE [Chitinophagaceae bacterium]